MMTIEERAKFDKLALQAGQVFNPNSPVNEKDLFSGRVTQIRRVVDVIFQRGQHAVIFGERGVGKTSLANVLSSFVGAPSVTPLITVRVNCDSGDDFTSVWRKLFDEVGSTIVKQSPAFKQAMGFKTGITQESCTADDFVPRADITPNDIRKGLNNVTGFAQPVLIVDEFDRLSDGTRRLFADLIKSLSDYSVPATMIIIGVGDSIDSLISEHQSITRAIEQIQMPRMSPEEIKAIVTNGLNRLGMNIADSTLFQLSLLVKGLPHYAHLIGLHATRAALDRGSLVVADEDLVTAIKKAIEGAQHSIKTSYFTAIKSAKKDTLFADVLLACALANVDDMGEFAAKDLREPLQKITGKMYDYKAYFQHLFEFSEDTRGNILIKSGKKRLYRYKFSDPLLQPFVLMQGVLNKKIPTLSFLQKQEENRLAIQQELGL